MKGTSDTQAKATNCVCCPQWPHDFLSVLPICSALEDPEEGWGVRAGVVVVSEQVRSGRRKEQTYLLPHWRFLTLTSDLS